MSLMLGDDTGNVLQRVNGVLDSLNTGTATPDQVNSVLNDIGNTLINTASVVFCPEKKRKPGKSGTCNNNHGSQGNAKQNKMLFIERE